MPGAPGYPPTPPNENSTRWPGGWRPRCLPTPLLRAAVRANGPELAVSLDEVHSVLRTRGVAAVRVHLLRLPIAPLSGSCGPKAVSLALKWDQLGRD